MRILSHSPEQTHEAARAFAARLRPGAIVLLYGDLGAGKTEFTRALVSALGSGDAVSSPSFIVMNVYQGRLPVYHFDFYRLSGPEEVWEMGLEDYFGGDGIAVVEWPERAPEVFARFPVWKIRLTTGEGDERILEIADEETQPD